jgi:hypothetical protein
MATKNYEKQNGPSLHVLAVELGLKDLAFSEPWPSSFCLATTFSPVHVDLHPCRQLPSV